MDEVTALSIHSQEPKIIFHESGDLFFCGLFFEALLYAGHLNFITETVHGLLVVVFMNRAVGSGSWVQMFGGTLVLHTALNPPRVNMLNLFSYSTSEIFSKPFSFPCCSQPQVELWGEP